MVCATCLTRASSRDRPSVRSTHVEPTALAPERGMKPMTKPQTRGTKLISDNRNAYREYEVLEKYEAGIVLQGTEVKSLREGKVNLKDAFAKIVNGEVFLVGLHISPYSHGT